MIVLLVFAFSKSKRVLTGDASPSEVGLSESWGLPEEGVKLKSREGQQEEYR